MEKLIDFFLTRNLVLRSRFIYESNMKRSPFKITIHKAAERMEATRVRTGNAQVPHEHFGLVLVIYEVKSGVKLKTKR